MAEVVHFLRSMISNFRSTFASSDQRNFYIKINKNQPHFFRSRRTFSFFRSDPIRFFAEALLISSIKIKITLTFTQNQDTFSQYLFNFRRALYRFHDNQTHSNMKITFYQRSTPLYYQKSR